ncbi:gag-protease polyprotein, partial [Trifolium pratense]
MLTRKFENLSMKEDESIHDFYMTVIEYANNFDILGEKMDDEKLIRKILRSLTKKFDMKVTAIEEAQDITKMKVDELIGSLQTYESTQNEKLEKKNKSIAFMSNADEEELDVDIDSTDSISEAIVLLERQFKKVLKKMDIRPKENGMLFTPYTSRNIETPRKPKTNDKLSQSKGVQCHECEGYGHARTECATYLKKQKKNLTVSWSDEEEYDNDVESETAKQITPLTGIYTSETESCDEELSYDELAESYRELCLRSEEVCRALEKQKETISQLQTERCDNISRIDALQKKVNHLTFDLGEAKNVIEKLNVDIWRLRKFSDMLYKDDDHIK